MCTVYYCTKHSMIQLINMLLPKQLTSIYFNEVKPQACIYWSNYQKVLYFNVFTRQTRQGSFCMSPVSWQDPQTRSCCRVTMEMILPLLLLFLLLDTGWSSSAAGYTCYTCEVELETKAFRRFPKISQSQRKPLLGPPLHLVECGVFTFKTLC